MYKYKYLAVRPKFQNNSYKTCYEDSNIMQLLQ